MRKMLLTLMAGVAAGALLAAGGPAAARDLAGRNEVGPFLGGYVFDPDDVDLENNLILGGRVGHWFTQDVVGELSVGWVPTESKIDGGDGNLIQTHLDALYHLNFFGDRFVPFLAAGAGAAMYDIDAGEGSDWDWLVNYGVGLKYWINDTIAARLDLRQPVSFDGTQHNFMYTVGVSWLLGGAPAAPAPAAAPPPVPAPPPAPVRAPAPKAVLTANPGTIQQGQSSTLSWTTENANDVSISGLGAVPANGSRSVTPGQTTSYRLTAKGEGGSQDATAQVTVLAPAPGDADKDGVTDDKDKCPGTPAGVKVDAQGCPLDSDKDGVYDSDDKCPGTPVGVKVDAVGCPLDSDKDGVYDSDDKCPGTPAGVKVDAVGCPLDSDKDGVYDYLDKCPGTPAGVAVDSQGCPLDSDQDGVYDYLDQCPTTPKGLKVDTQGCSIEKLRMRIKIEFDTAKDVIKPEFHDELAKIGDFMKQYPQTNVTIEGHTDSVGSEEYNMKLSQRRADSVKAYLQDKFGVDAGRISAKGYGPTKPIADNATPEGRAQNRRTEAVVDEVVIKK